MHSRHIVIAKPFLKWAGGKAQLLEQFTPLLPGQFGNYCEPFVGSAAVFWRLVNLRNQGKVNFIYFDPPYAPLSRTSNFTNYTQSPFGEKEQRELADVFRGLSERGCKLMLSNSWVEPVLALYKDFNCIQVKASRAINSNPGRRGKINELLVINYDC